MPKQKNKPVKSKSSNRISKYLNSYNFIGVIMGSLFAILSFTPSLLPRGWVMQALMVGVCFSLGYAIGLFMSWSIRQFDVKEPSITKTKQIKRVVYVILALLFCVAVIYGFDSQKQVTALVGMPAPTSASVIGIILVSAVVIVIIMGISRLIKRLFTWLLKHSGKLLPRSFAITVALFATFIITAGLFNGLIMENVREAINTAYGTRNDSTDEGIVKPENPELSGSPQSKISWDSLGKQGRSFIGSAVPSKKIEEFSKEPAKNPVRIYAGLKSADSATERAKLAVDDLERAGGFNRKVLVVVTTTGTGWVNETPASAIEYMYGGDSAIVSMQYSYLPSWISFLVDKDKAKESGVELYNAVLEKWISLPNNERPKLVSYGESLGSFGGEAAFASPSSFKATSQGVLFVGPPSSNKTWQDVVASRETQSPQILPIVNNGKTVRFAGESKDLENPTTEWQKPRAVYLQHGSDPIVWWSPRLLWSKPDWLKESRAKDVSTQTIWVPLVTFFQVSGDMAFSTAVPDGYGHNYGTLPIDAWAKIIPPSGWTDADTQALKTVISNGKN